METLVIVIQVIIAMGIFNVWLLRLRRPSEYRPKNANNMMEEFEAYGLPKWFMQFIGFLKLLFAIALIAGIWVNGLVLPAAVGMVILMVGAIAMHLKVKDPMIKSLPAFSLLLLSLVVAIYASG